MDIVEVTDPFRLRVGTFAFANALFAPFKHCSRWILMKCQSDLSKCQVFGWAGLSVTEKRTTTPYYVLFSRVEICCSSIFLPLIP
ncbi:hypothetical protein BDW42DRAFT_167943 [Aspergillus taichungensis]|uniref:Uncharacterized protein n=1 Tax=Aspergillus taichungensis TaxID=482145 RepID=A0A2J5HWV9_9EURO|nr:hypothetical protein BDW42DRAFT_167943 [Aspergillus taichungensis]